MSQVWVPAAATCSCSVLNQSAGVHVCVCVLLQSVCSHTGSPLSSLCCHLVVNITEIQPHTHTLALWTTVFLSLSPTLSINLFLFSLSHVTHCLPCFPPSSRHTHTHTHSPGLSSGWRSVKSCWVGPNYFFEDAFLFSSRLSFWWASL